MVTILSTLLVTLGFLLGLLLAGAWRAGWFLQSAEPAADPYRDGLDAVARISAVAWEAERLLFEVAEQDKREETR